ncbi:hypothetical protein M2283_008934 [Streptomyces pseudovenezuelae]|uniref:Transposase IS116/IS110/IS902 C-terminal domain-containing protein n=1 Tax=Streptomyces pseudovenezuelae TaxID=67350 RepID=A0ABT6LZ54_9ACTN|nr:hypothetical protein [Streptomyces pseudovenezuelae]
MLLHLRFARVRFRPGNRDRLAAGQGAAFIAATGGDMDVFGSADRLAGYAGLAPVPCDSGRVRGNLRRPTRFHRGLLDAMYLFALSSLKSCPASKAYYARKRAQGKGHKQALPALARRRGGGRRRPARRPCVPSRSPGPGPVRSCRRPLCLFWPAGRIWRRRGAGGGGGERYLAQRSGELAAQDELGPYDVFTGRVGDRPGPLDGDVRTERADGQQPFIAGRALDAVTQRSGAVRAQPDTLLSAFASV